MTENNELIEQQTDPTPITGDFIPYWCKCDIRAKQTLWKRKDGTSERGYALEPVDPTYPRKWLPFNWNKYRLELQAQPYGLTVIRHLVHPDVDDIHDLTGKVTLFKYQLQRYNEEKLIVCRSLYLGKGIRISGCMVSNISVSWQFKGSSKIHDVSLFAIFKGRRPYECLDFSDCMAQSSHNSLTFRIGKLYILIEPGENWLKRDAESIFKTDPNRILVLKKLL